MATPFVGGLVGNLFNRFVPKPVQAASLPISSQINRQASNYRPPISSQIVQSAQNFRPAQSSAINPQAQNYRPPIQSVNTGGGNSAPQQQSAPQNNPPQQNNPAQEYFEPQPEYQEPEVDISQDLRLAEETVNQGVADYEASIAGIGTRTAQSRADLEAQKQQQATETGRIKGEATGSTEEAINESRRTAAEIQQGIAARYGASVSTGMGASAILGAQTVRVISEARTKLTQVVSFLDQKQKDLDYDVFRAEEIINSQGDELKAQARAELQKAQVAAQSLRAGASRFKQSLVSEALARYRDTVNSVNARNTAFKQTLYLKQQEQQAEIDRIRENAKIKSQDMANANSKYVTNLYESMAKSGQLSTQGFNQFEERVGVPTGTFIPKKEEDEDPFDALRKLKNLGAGNV